MQSQEHSYEHSYEQSSIISPGEYVQNTDPRETGQQQEDTYQAYAEGYTGSSNWNAWNEGEKLRPVGTASAAGKRASSGATGLGSRRMTHSKRQSPRSAGVTPTARRSGARRAPDRAARPGLLQRLLRSKTGRSVRGASPSCPRCRLRRRACHIPRTLLQRGGDDHRDPRPCRPSRPGEADRRRRRRLDRWDGRSRRVLAGQS